MHLTATGPGTIGLVVELGPIIGRVELPVGPWVAFDADPLPGNQGVTAPNLVAGQSLRLDIFGDVTQGDGREGQFQVRYPRDAVEFLHVDPLPGLNGAESIVLVFQVAPDTLTSSLRIISASLGYVDGTIVHLEAGGTLEVVVTPPMTFTRFASLFGWSTIDRDFDSRYDLDGQISFPCLLLFAEAVAR